MDNTNKSVKIKLEKTHNFMWMGVWLIIELLTPDPTLRVVGFIMVVATFICGFFSEDTIEQTGV